MGEYFLFAIAVLFPAIWTAYIVRSMLVSEIRSIQANNQALKEGKDYWKREANGWRNGYYTLLDRAIAAEEKLAKFDHRNRKRGKNGRWRA